jgi:flagellar protein FlgJ
MEALSALPTSYLSLGKTASPAHGARDARTWAAAQDFEAQFISTMFQSMFEGVGDDNPYSGGPGETMFRSVLVDQYGRQMAKSGGIGIADDIYREILKMQELPK